MKYMTSLYLHVSKSHNAIVIFSVSPQSTNVAWSLQNCHFKSIIQETFCCSKAWNPCTNDDNIDSAFSRIWRHCLVHLKSTHEPHSNATVDYVINRADSFFKTRAFVALWYPLPTLRSPCIFWRHFLCSSSYWPSWHPFG